MDGSVQGVYGRFGDCDDEAIRLVEDARRFYDIHAEIEECGMEAKKPKSVIEGARILRKAYGHHEFS